MSANANDLQITDFHTHIFADSLAPRARTALEESAAGLYKPFHDMTLKGLIESMDEAGIHRSVVLPVITKRSQTEKVCEWAASIQSERITSFGGIFPLGEDYREQIDFVCSLGLKGIKLHAEYQNFVLDDERMLKVYDYAFEKGLIVVHHAGFDPAFPAPFKTSPKQFARVIGELKGGVMIAAHLGGQRQWDDVERYLAGSDIYLDTSMGFGYYGREQFLRILGIHGAERMLFATDSPWSDQKSELASFESLGLAEHDRELILCGNARRLLGES